MDCKTGNQEALPSFVLVPIFLILVIALLGVLDARRKQEGTVNVVPINLNSNRESSKVIPEIKDNAKRTLSSTLESGSAQVQGPANSSPDQSLRKSTNESDITTKSLRNKDSAQATERIHSQASPHVHALQREGKGGYTYSTSGSLHSTGVATVEEIKNHFRSARAQSSKSVGDREAMTGSGFFHRNSGGTDAFLKRSL